MPSVLLASVGTGNLDDLETSLFVPLRKSIANGDWTAVILLPSRLTQQFAADLAARLDGLPVTIHPLPVEDAENNADDCFAHFDSVIENLLATGCDRSDLVIDFTRGTKAMSAALVLAAVRHELPRLRYISGQRDRRGMVEGGTEEIRQISTRTALSRRDIDQALALVRGGSFAAALTLLPNPDHPLAGALGGHLPDPEMLREVRRVCAFLSAWDRLDYTGAMQDPPLSPARTPPSWQRWAPTADHIAWVRRLSRMPDRDRHTDMADWLGMVAVDLLANTERRVAFGQYEDALVRAYRVLELIGQARLFRLGVDSETVPGDDPELARLEQDRAKRGTSQERRDKDGAVKLGREMTARLLKRKGDSLAPQLLQFADQARALKAKNRNVSILIHGFTTTAPANVAEWEPLIDGLWALIDKATDTATAARPLARHPGPG